MCRSSFASHRLMRGVLSLRSSERPTLHDLPRMGHCPVPFSCGNLASIMALSYQETRPDTLHLGENGRKVRSQR